MWWTAQTQNSSPEILKITTIRNIKDKAAQKNIRTFIDEGKVEEAFEYIKIYADSVASNDKSNKAEEKANKLNSNQFKEYAYNIYSIGLKFEGDFSNATKYSQISF